MIKGIHHFAMTCRDNNDYERVMNFYVDLLGLKVARAWDGGAMLDAGNSLIEIFVGADKLRSKGIIEHFAFLVDDIDEIIKDVEDAGYEIINYPHEQTIECEVPYHITWAFVRGPLGEEVELFVER